MRQRPADTANPKIPTGDVEVVAEGMVVHNHAEVLPFQIDDPEAAAKVNEERRLQYRYLDLRRPEMAHNLRLRSKVATCTRVFMEEEGFLEIETYRYREHVGPDYDWDLGYRTEHEVLEHMAKDPVPQIRSKIPEAIAIGIECALIIGEKNHDIGFCSGQRCR